MEDRIYINRYLPTPFSKGWKIMFVKMFFFWGGGGGIQIAICFYLLIFI